MDASNIIFFLLTSLVFAAAIVAVIAWVFLKQPKTPNLHRTRRLLTPLENILFKKLESALADDFYVFSKVSLSKVVEVGQNTGPIDKFRIQKCLDKEYVDFVLCEKRDLSIFGVICLHRSNKSVKASQAHQQRCEKIEQACSAACLRVFHFDLNQSYQDVDLLNVITGRPHEKSHNDSVSINESSVSQNVSQSRYTVADSEYAVSAAKRRCPKCDSPLVTKIAKNGKLKGQKFILCTDYPSCDYKISRSQDLRMRKIAS